MNTVEHIVECYFRICLKCFTMHDVKVASGNNRQFDLLAVSLLDGRQYHVESSVTHCENWCPSVDDLIEKFDRKFFGVPIAREGANTDHTRGRTYQKEIFEMYEAVGLTPEKIERIYCCWIVPNEPGLHDTLRNYCAERRIRPIRVIGFRDEVLPELEKTVATSNYEDEALRTLSLLQQKSVQTRAR